MNDTRIPVNSGNGGSAATATATAGPNAATSPKAPAAKPAAPAETTILPRVDIVEAPESWTLAFDLPGARREDIALNIEDDTLTIEAPVALKQPGDALLREFEVTRYRREFRLGEAIDTDNARAELRHGVLVLTLPRRRQRVEIPVKINSGVAHDQPKG
jgi:HSP20 family molecular chaperone IbpA